MKLSLLGQTGRPPREGIRWALPGFSRLSLENGGPEFRGTPDTICSIGSETLSSDSGSGCAGVGGRSWARLPRRYVRTLTAQDDTG